METETCKIDSLVFDPHNVRRHPDRQIEMLAKSLQRFGQRRPIVVQRTTRQVLAGNGLLAAAVRLGHDTIEVLFVDDDADKARAFAIADNKASELGAWDIDELIAAASDVGEDMLSELGFAEEEIDKLLRPTADVKKTDAFWGIGDKTAPARKNQAVSFVVFTDDAEAIGEAIDRAMDADPMLFSRGHALAVICRGFHP